MRNILLAVLTVITALFISSCKQVATDPAADQNAGVSSLNKSSGNVALNIVLNTDINDKIIKELNSYGKILDIFYELKAVRLMGKGDVLSKIQALPFVEGANPDAERNAPPIDAVPVENFIDGLSTWNLDAVNVTDVGFDNRTVTEDGSGVIIGVLDSGLLDSWRQYFPQERILTQYAKSFGGGGAGGLNVSEQPNKWEHDQNSHGTHVTSTIIGYSLNGTPVNGVAPMAQIVPVKVLNQNGSGWSSVIAQGIVYMADLKETLNKPVVINMSLGGRSLDALEKAAIDYAIKKGVIVVASAGNNGMYGMGYPGAYAPVISVASAGTDSAFTTSTWWYTLNIPDPLTQPEYSDYFYISDFSSRAVGTQDLDVTAPGEWIVGPYQVQSGKTSYYYLSGTSMACPHVTGIVALMLQKNSSLTADQAESKLESVAIPIDGYTSSDYGAGFITADAALDEVPE